MYSKVYNNNNKKMNKFKDFFENYQNKLLIDKWDQYLGVYDRHFKKFIGKKPRILEIGSAGGGSLEMWNYYFDKECDIYGIDINFACLKIPEKLGAENISITIGNQEDRDFWKNFLKDKQKFDIIIDDGGHTMKQQIVTFQEVYDHISDDGVFLCEDLHTSYYPNFGGGLNNPKSFIEFSKKLIDGLHSYYYHGDNTFRKITDSIHYYDSVIVIEKKFNPERPNRIIKKGSLQ